MKKHLVTFSIALLTACGGGGGESSQPTQRQELSTLGRKIFFDTTLSSPEGVSCATCHSPNSAFSDPSHGQVSHGALQGTKGTRNAPSIMYSAFTPRFHYSDDHGDYIGGQFWDGRAGDQEEQARQPFFGHVEMNLASTEDLRARIATAPYAADFTALFGEQTLTDPEQTVIAVTQAIAAFEHSSETRPFSSKYDAWVAGKANLTPQEQRGLRIFNAPNKGNCAACHPSEGRGESADHALFTDFTYDNVGLPSTSHARNDIGLAGVTGRDSDTGRFKVPSLRNVAVTAPYFHNGAIATLKDAVHFYNVRDVDPSIPSPEFPQTMNVVELGALGLTDQEEDDLVAFLGTLTDGYLAH